MNLRKSNYNSIPDTPYITAHTVGNISGHSVNINHNRNSIRREFLEEMRDKYSHIEEIVNDIDIEIMETNLSDSDSESDAIHSRVLQSAYGISSTVWGGSHDV